MRSTRPCWWRSPTRTSSRGWPSSGRRRSPADRATPEAHTEQLESQIELWRPIIEDAGVTAGWRSPM